MYPKPPRETRNLSESGFHSFDIVSVCFSVVPVTQQQAYSSIDVDVDVSFLENETVA